MELLELVVELVVPVPPQLARLRPTSNKQGKRAKNALREKYIIFLALQIK